MPDQKINVIVPKSASILKVIDQFTTIQHETATFKIQSIGANTDVYIDGKRHIGLTKDGVSMMLLNTTSSSIYTTLTPTANSKDLGLTTNCWGKVFIHDFPIVEAQGTLVFNEVDGVKIVCLPHTMNTNNYLVVAEMEYNSGIHNPSVITYRIDGKTTTQFEMRLLDEDGSGVDCSSDNQVVEYALYGRQ